MKTKAYNKKPSVLALGFAKGILIPEGREEGDSSKRLKFYAEYLDKYFAVVFSPQKAGLIPRTFGNLYAIPTGGATRAHAFWNMYKIGDKICRENKIDVIQSQDPIYTGLIGHILSKKYRKPFNICVYGSDPYNRHWVRESFSHRLFAGLGKYMLARAQGIQADGTSTVKNLVNNNIDSQKIAQKPLIPPNISSFYGARGAAIRRAILGSRDASLLLFVGRLTRQKNVPFMLRAYKRILQEHSKAHLLIIGSGPLEQKMHRLIRELDIGDYVTTKRSVPYSKIPEYFAASDVFLLTSIYEGFARVLMEAAASGRPIVTTDVSGASDAVVHGVSGFILAQGDEDGFIAKTLLLLQSPSAAQKMGREAERIAKKRFDPELTLLKQIEIWRNLSSNA